MCCTNSKSAVTFGTHTNTHPHPCMHTTQHPDIPICHGHGWWIYNVKFSYCINTTQLSGVKQKKSSPRKTRRWCAHAIFFVSTSSLFPHLTALIHLYSAELLEPLSDKAMKERVRDGWSRMGEEEGPAVPQWWKWVFPELLLTYLMTHNSCFKYPCLEVSLRWLVWIDGDKNRDGDMALNSWWNCN